MANGAISAVLWPGCKAEVGEDLLNGGILANKPGYHNTRERLRRSNPNDYSIQLEVDLQGPSDLGSAIDLTFKSAQGGDYRNIAKYSRRLFEAGKDRDPRAYPMREFYGNTDNDSGVEGWSYYRNEARSSDPSHAWHIHISIYRKYINDADAMRSILSIFRGEDMPLSEADIDKIQKSLLEPDFVQKFATVFLTRDNIIPNEISSDPTNKFLTPRGQALEVQRALNALKGQTN